MFELNFWTLMRVSGFNMGLDGMKDRNMIFWNRLKHASLEKEARWFCWI